jgi:hypothetical protein
MATVIVSRYDDGFFPTIGDLTEGESGYVMHDALWMTEMTEGHALVLRADAPVLADESAGAHLFVIRTATGFLVDATACARRLTARTVSRPAPAAPVIAVMYGDGLLR